MPDPRPAAEALAVALIVTAAAALLAWPVPIAPSRFWVGGSMNDHHSLAWTFDFVATRLFAGEWPWGHTAQLEAPAGATLFPADLPEAVLLAPLVVAFGATAVLNGLQLAHHGLAAGAGWGWLRAEGATPTGAATGALAVAFHAAMTTGTFNGNPDTTPLYFAPLALWAVAAPGLGRAALAGVCCGVGGFASPYVGVIATVAVAARLAVDRRGRELVVAVAIAGAFAVAAVVAHTAAMEAVDAAIRKGTRRDRMGTAGLLDLLRPAPYVIGTDRRWDAPKVAVGAYVGVALVVAAARAPGRSAFGWALVAIGATLALGPSLRLWTPHGDGPPPGLGSGLVPMPWALAAALPGLGQLTLTARFTSLAVLGLTWLAARAAPRWGRLGGALGVAVAADFLVAGRGARLLAAAPVWDDGSAAAVAALPDGAVVDVPPTFHELWLYASIHHRHPVAEGINRPLPVPVRRALERGEPRLGASLRAMGYRWLVVHGSIAPMDADDRAPAVPGCEAATGERFVVYDLDCAAR